MESSSLDVASRPRLRSRTRTVMKERERHRVHAKTDVKRG